MAKKTIAHAIFRYHDDEGREVFALRGETVELSPADVKFGEKHDAFVKPADAKAAPAAGQSAPPPELEPFPMDGDDDAKTAWMAKATIPQVTTEADRGDDVKTAMLEAEQRRGDDARTTLLTALSR
jgi:hypothetical protein